MSHRKLTVEDVLGKRWLKSHEKELRKLVRNCIKVHENRDGTSLSKLGGLPDLPLSLEWPTYTVSVEGKPSEAFLKASGGSIRMPPADGVQSIPFLAQFAFSELAPFDLDGVLPSTGYMFIFDGYEWFDVDQEEVAEDFDRSPLDLLETETSIMGFGDEMFRTKSFYPCVEDTSKVLFWDGPQTEMRRREIPGNTAWLRDHPNGYREIFLTLASEASLPRGEDGNVGMMNDPCEANVVLSEKNYYRYEKLLAELGGGEYENKLLGHPHQWAGGITLPDQLSTGSASLDATNRILLLELSSELLHSMGVLSTRDDYWFICKEDLDRKFFDRVWRGSS